VANSAKEAQKALEKIWAGSYKNLELSDYVLVKTLPVEAPKPFAKLPEPEPVEVEEPKKVTKPLAKTAKKPQAKTAKKIAKKKAQKRTAKKK
jgi:hypothetical protein